MRHEDIWRALDTLAAEKGLTPSRLARAAGLDATAFNRSKRAGAAGLRWPGTDTLARVLAATGTSLDAFAALVGGARVLAGDRGRSTRHLPLLPLSRLGQDGLFDGSGRPCGPHWAEAAVPQPGGPGSYAVEVDGARLEPCFREGGMLILSSDAPARPGDRVLLRPGHGPPGLFVLTARNGDRLHLSSLDRLHADQVAAQGGVAWMHRLTWAGY